MTKFLALVVALAVMGLSGCATLAGSIGVLFPDGSRMDIGSDGKQINTTIRLPVGYSK